MFAIPIYQGGNKIVGNIRSMEVSEDGKHWIATIVPYNDKFIKLLNNGKAHMELGGRKIRSDKGVLVDFIVEEISIVPDEE